MTVTPDLVVDVGTHIVVRDAADTWLGEELREALTFKNPEYDTWMKEKIGPPWARNKEICLVEYDGDDLVLPRGFLRDFL